MPTNYYVYKRPGLRGYHSAGMEMEAPLERLQEEGVLHRQLPQQLSAHALFGALFSNAGSCRT